MSQTERATSDRAQTPDPSFSCSLYASGAVDQAIVGWILPFRRRWRSLEVDASTCLWLWRHARHGEHLKLRVHATAPDLPVLRLEAERSASDFLARLTPVADGGKKKSMPWPAIDADEDDEPLPEDRSFRFTRYQRQAPIFGSPTLCEDAVYVARFCRCLGSAHDWILDELESNGGFTAGFSFRLLTSLIITALDSALDKAEAPGLLASYRDWLIRLPLRRQGADQATADAWSVKIHRRALELESGDLVERLASPWRGLPPAAAPWKTDLQRFCTYARSAREHLGEEPGELETTLIDQPLCKILLALANALGYGMVDQAVVAHLLLFSLDPERAAQSIRLTTGGA